MFKNLCQQQVKIVTMASTCNSIYAAFYCILKCIKYLYFHNLCYNHSIVMTACIKMNNICILLYKENLVFQKSNGNEQNKAARKMKVMTWKDPSIIPLKLILVF